MALFYEIMDAIVLSGGAAYGAYEVGVLKALSEKKGFDPEIITGTSVGGFNAAVLTTESIQRLEEIWRTDIPEKGLEGNGVLRIRGNPFPYFASSNPLKLVSEFVGDSAYLTRMGFERSGAFFRSHGGPGARISELVDISAFISCEPLAHLIAKNVSMPGIRNSRKKLRIIATDWEAGVPRVFTNEDMTDAEGAAAIMASTAIPGVFPPVDLNGTIYVDGGVVMNTPLKPAMQAGADNIHVISLVPAIGRIESDELDNTLEAMLRLVQILLSSAVQEDIATAGWINAGLDAMERTKAGEDISTDQLRDFVRVADQLKTRAAEGSRFHRVIIHHYQPSRSLGSPLGLLDFTRSNIESLIARGFDDTVQHMCTECGCIVPKEGIFQDPVPAAAAVA